jgi:hypothetical protein
MNIKILQLMLFRKNTDLKVSLPSQDVSPVAAVSSTCETTILDKVNSYLLDEP